LSMVPRQRISSSACAMIETTFILAPSPFNPPNPRLTL
jgi:hypothetical protein